MERIDKRSKKWKNMSQEEKDDYETQRIAGGKRSNAGRKSKVEEQQLIEKLDNLIDSDNAITILGNLILNGDFRALQMYFNYRFGKPKESVDVTSGGEKFDMPIISFFATDDEDED